MNKGSLKPDTACSRSFSIRKNRRKKSVELVPRSWITFADGKWFTYYPNEEDYNHVSKWSKESKEPEVDNWKMFEIYLLKEAHSYSQGSRRLNQSFVTDHIVDSSQCESDYDAKKKKIITNPNDMPKILTNEKRAIAVKQIPNFPEKKNENIQKVPTSKTAKQSTQISKKKQSETSVPFKNANSTLQSSDRSLSSTSSDGLEDDTKKSTLLPKSNKALDADLSTGSIEDSMSSNASSINRSKTMLEQKAGPSSKNDLSIESLTDASNEQESPVSSINGSKTKLIQKDGPSSLNSEDLSIESLIARMNKIQEDLQNLKENFDGKLDKLKRSMQYDLKVRFDQLVHLLTTKFTSTDTAKELEIFPALPKDNISDFLEFDKQLIENQEMRSALKTFMDLQSRALTSSRNVVSTILPMILTTKVQLVYSGFGVTNYKGEKKFDFSSTQTYCILKEIHLQKYPDVPLRDFNNYITCWFSNAIDRDGGKKNRKLQRPAK